MKPSQIASSLLRIAKSIQASKQPNRNLVIKDLQKLLTSLNHIASPTNNLIVTNVKSVEEETSGMPAFLVSGTWKGHPFVYEVAVEIDGNNAEWNHKSGVDPRDPSNQDFNDWLNAEEIVYNDIYDSPDYKEQVENYYSSLT